jgi:SET domain-containing protein
LRPSGAGVDETAITIVMPSTLAGAGNGLFTVTPIANGETVTYYGGRRVRKEDVRLWSAEQQVYVKSLPLSRWDIDGRECFDEQTERGRYINQAPVGTNPNVKFQVLSSSNKRRRRDVDDADEVDERRVAIVATHDIADNEELFISYGSKMVKAAACERAIDRRRLRCADAHT